MTEAVRAYFNRVAGDFDALYGGKGHLRQWIDRHFRGDIYERYRLTFEVCGDVKGKAVLDIGCGSGRYSVEFARRGATQVLGIDFAPNMVELAHGYAEKDGSGDRCKFMAGNFLEMDLSQRFDICLAVGVFDYVSQPRAFLEKMTSMARELVIVSFPSRSPIRTPIRKIRYWWKHCPVYFYDREGIERLVAGLGRAKIIKIPGQGMDYFVSIECFPE